VAGHLEIGVGCSRGHGLRSGERTPVE